MRPTYLRQALLALVPLRRPILIKGPPGVGKTDIVGQTAGELKYDLLISHPVVDDPIDYKGLPHIGADGHANFLPIGHMRELIEASKPTIFFMDDLGQATPAVQAAAMQLLLARAINGQKVSEHVTFMAATNRKQDKAGVSGVLEPVKSRFVTILELEPNIDDWCNWAIEHDIPSKLIAFMQFKPGLLCEFKPTADITNSPCPRTIANVGHILKAQALPLHLRPDIVEGAVGAGFAAEFEGFLKVYEKLPDPREVLKDPKKFKLGEIKDIATIYALCIGMAEYAKAANAGNFFDALSAFDPEFGFCAVQMASKRDMSIVRTKEHVEWVLKNQKVLL